MIPHNDPCLNPDLNRELNGVSRGAYTNFNGEYTLAIIDKFDEDFRKSIVQQSSSNILVKMVEKYGNDFYESLSGLNEDFLKRPYISTEVPNFELLSQRIKGGRYITAFEYAQFLNDYNYTPYSSTDSYNQAGRRYLSELDSFYRGGFQQSILGSFCSLVPNIFAAIDGFFDLIDDIQGLIGDVFAFLNKIKNNEDPLKALWEKIQVQALIEAIQKKVEDAVKGVIKKVQKMIENFSFQNVMGQIETFVNEKIVKKVTQLKDDILAFFSEENINKIISRVNGMINYAVSVFENPSLEEIYYLVMKFCSFVTGVEGVINGLKTPLDDFSNRYEEVIGTVANASNRVTGEAVRAGAIRFEQEKRKEVINKQEELQVEAGDIPKPEPKKYEEVPSWEEVVSGNHPKIKVQGQWVDKLGRPGWDNIDRDAKVKLIQIWDAMSEAGLIFGPFLVNSGWRSVEYNNSIGGAKSSQHLQGKAMDISWNFFDSNDQKTDIFVTLARKVGFGGIGFYKSFRHIDLGPVRTWGDVNTVGEDGIIPIMTAGEARELAKAQKNNFKFIDPDNEYQTYQATYKESNREGYTENGVETSFGGSVSISLVRK